MARCLIVGCGCRGRLLAGELRLRGHVVRGTTRRPESLPEIEAAGAEAVLADPDRVSTLFPALDHVSVVVLLLGTASGDAESLSALFGTRLQMLMHKALDTTVRGVVFEASGSAGAALLGNGEEVVRAACAGSRIPCAAIEAEPGSREWAGAAVAAVESVLAAV